ncbi:MAG: ABC transporter permease [Kamptonema sp. SIO4C4]|nr:ABC transporter permease [Kamptonema sp. SIO4C4]
MLYLLQHFGQIALLLGEHLQMTLIAVGIGVGIALPLGAVVSDRVWLRVPLLGILGTVYTIPSLALMILLIPWFGLNATTVIVAMVLYIQIILVRNVLVALDSLPPDILEAATGMGMTGWQCWWWVKFPLILPVFLAGVRLATLVAISIAAIGAKFGAGGLGTLLFEGVQQNRFDKIWAGTIVLAIAALLLHNGLRWLENWVSATGTE